MIGGEDKSQEHQPNCEARWWKHHGLVMLFYKENRMDLFLGKDEW